MSSHLPNTPPRIAVFSVEFPPGPGGVGTHAYQLARHLSCRDWDVSVVSPQDFASNDEISAFNRGLPFDLVPLRATLCALLEALYRFTKGLLHVAHVRPGHPFPRIASLLLILLLPDDPGTKATS
jgi:hypothetical protein